MSGAPLEPAGAVSSSRDISRSQTRVFVEALQVEAVVGVYPHEKDMPQPICIDLEVLIKFGFDKDVKDTLTATLDYDWAVKQMLEVIGQAPVDLLETLARTPFWPIHSPRP